MHADPSQPFHPTFPDPVTTRQLSHLVAQFRPHVVQAHSWLINSWLPLRRRWPQVRTVAYAHDYGLFCARKTNQRDAAGPGCGAPGLARCVSCGSGQYGTAKSAALATGMILMRRLTRRLDALTAVSTAVSSTLAAALDVPAPTVIPPAIDLSRMLEATRPSFLPQGPYVLYVGQLSPHKGVDVLLRAVRATPGLHLVMLGMPKAGWSPPDDPDVTVLLDVPHPTVMAAWRHATVGVVPSLWADPMPLVSLEAMSQGCPLVVSAVGGLVDAVEDGVTGRLVPAGDAEALGRELAKIAQDRSLRSRMGAAALARSAAFDLDAVVDRWSDLYARLPAGRPGAVQWT
jgi:glycosyltransferase involved in cell wall biosynthesis